MQRSAKGGQQTLKQSGINFGKPLCTYCTVRRLRGRVQPIMQPAGNVMGKTLCLFSETWSKINQSQMEIHCNTNGATLFGHLGPGGTPLQRLVSFCGMRDWNLRTTSDVFDWWKRRGKCSWRQEAAGSGMERFGKIYYSMLCISVRGRRAKKNLKDRRHKQAHSPLAGLLWKQEHPWAWSDPEGDQWQQKSEIHTVQSQYSWILSFRRYFA